MENPGHDKKQEPFTALEYFPGEDRLFVVANDPDRAVIRAVEKGTDLKHAKELYDELARKYHVPVADWIGVRGPAGDRIVVERLRGEQVDDVVGAGGPKEHREEFVKQLGELYGHLTDYLIDKYRDEGDLLWDVYGAFQYLWGTKEGDPQPKIRLIDLDTRYASKKNGVIGPVSPNITREDLLMEDLLDIINTVLGYKVSLPDFNLDFIKQKFTVFINSIDPATVNSTTKLLQIKMRL